MEAVKNIRTVMIERIKQMVIIGWFTNKDDLKRDFEALNDKDLVDLFERTCQDYYQDYWPNA